MTLLTASSSYGLSNFQDALNILTHHKTFVEDFESAVILSAEAFHTSQISVLDKYRAAACLRESHLRQVVQLLIARGSSAASSAVRLLLVLSGLPGSDELVYNLLSYLSIDCFGSFDSSTLTILAFLAGPAMIEACPISNLLSSSLNAGKYKNRLALSFAFSAQHCEQVESVGCISDWDTETAYAYSPSFWRELAWAAFARSCCVCAGVIPLSHPSPDHHNRCFKALPASAGNGAHKYVCISGCFIDRRSVVGHSQPSRSSISNFDASSQGSQTTIVITRSLRPVFHDVTAAIAHGLPFILEGATGCGKTTLISFLARGTSRNEHVEEAPGVTFVQMDSVVGDGESESIEGLIGNVVPLSEGGGFRWRPGPVGLAIERGEWVVLENIGRGTGTQALAPLIHRLATLRTGDELEAPGRGESLRVSSGFRCIATHTTDDSTRDGWQPPGGWDLWLRLQMPSLSNDDILQILSERFPRVVDCVRRVVNGVSSVAQYTMGNSVPMIIRPNMRQAMRICNRIDRLRADGLVITAEIALQEALDTLVAWCADEKLCNKLVDIVASCWSLTSEVGRKLFFSYCPSYSEQSNLLQIGRAQDVELSHNASRVSSSLALNSHTLRLLERLLRCLQMEENILLTGEAGSGKTALIQELARLLGKKLVVVNLSRQSELGDLVGGFRPVGVAAAVPQLARKFEEVFCSCMMREKNLRFLDGLQKAARVPTQHQRALRLMRGAMNAMPVRLRAKSNNTLERWTALAREIETLEQLTSPPRNPWREGTEHQDIFDHEVSERPQKRPRSLNDLESSSKRRVDFRFFDGILVQAMRAGNWILLDEINLAPYELLERLVSIVDRGQVSLSNENGETVSQTSGFMLFGAMNPPTDAGKRPLPDVLRTRFSEFFVGDVSDIKDVTSVILHRFFKKGLKAMSTFRQELDIAGDVAQFFLKCCELSKQGRVEDMSGKPVRFSVRTLARMLDFANGICQYIRSGSDHVRRALYEGALIAFTTSLPSGCKTVLINLAVKHVLRSTKTKGKSCSISTIMSVPHGSNISFRVVEGFPIERIDQRLSGVNSTSPKFIISPTVKETLTTLCRAMLLGAPKFPILLQGPTAVGKTSIVTHLANVTGAEIVRINNHEHTELSEYVGGYVMTTDGSLRFSEGPLVRAARLGHWVLLDELNLAPPDVLEALNRLLDDNREILIGETGDLVKAAPGFRLFATQNPPGLYGGRKELSRAFRSRFVEVNVDELPDADLLMILEEKESIPKSFAQGMVSVMRELQIRRRATGVFIGREGYITARDLFRWSSRQPRSREELAIHGFLLLGERARQTSERDLVRDVLVKKLKVSKHLLNDNSLYTVGTFQETSASSHECLDFSLKRLGLSRQKLFDALEENGIVLTPHMSRMIVLMIHCMANKEPVLLVGATGSGKTSCCFMICKALHRAMITVNCHRHIEASDIVGGFRPVREHVDGEPLFHWCNGPLVESMLNGSAFLVDEINMAEDAVIERLNSVLEPERSFLLSEKGLGTATSPRPDLIIANAEFCILATMNPGGDFGKKELSPALRNRFSEMWIPQPNSMDDYIPIINHRLSTLFPDASSMVSEPVYRVLIDFLNGVLKCNDSTNKRSIDSFNITLRDLKAWLDFIVESSSLSSFDTLTALVHGARLVILDGLCVGSIDNRNNIIGGKLWQHLIHLLPKELKVKAESIKYTDSKLISMTWNQFSTGTYLEVDDFRLMHSSTPCFDNDRRYLSFSFEAPNIKRNTARLLRAMCVGQHPLLLEGPPGGGKTSLIAALASKAGFPFVRVNLSESTDISDLIGCDSPGEQHGTFSFHEGPLLNALRNGSWLLLDELNLASQSVLEGLNSVLDHRRTLFVPELNEELFAHETFRVFGAQNPAVEGSGRRGLPKSFLNRFIKVWVEPPDEEDILSIISSIHTSVPCSIAEGIVSVLSDVRNQLEASSLPGTFGLRDALRWCDMLSELGPFSPRCETSTGISNDCLSFYLDHTFDIVVLQGLSLEEDRKIAILAFEKAFCRRWNWPRSKPSVSAASHEGIRIGISSLQAMGSFYCYDGAKPCGSLVLPSRLRELQALSTSLQLGWATVLFSSSISAAHLDGRRLFEILATACRKQIRVVHGGSFSSSDDFIGTYNQKDLIWIIRRLRRLWRSVLHSFVVMTMHMAEGGSEEIFGAIIRLQNLLHKDVTHLQQSSVHDLSKIAYAFLHASTGVLIVFKNCPLLFKRLENLMSIIDSCHKNLEELLAGIAAGRRVSFEWRKSDLLMAIENGEWIFMENADQCPPAILDRLNPLFERPPVCPQDNTLEKFSNYPEQILLAEAPTKDDGSPIYLKPHPDFRIVFSVCNGGGRRSIQGLSRALLDRSLRIYLREKIHNDDKNAIFTSAGLPIISAVTDGLSLSTFPGDDINTRAARIRFSLATLGDSQDFENLSDANTFSSQGLKQRKPLKSHDRIARTSSFSLTVNTRNALLQRDLCCLRELESISDSLVNTLLKSTWAFKETSLSAFIVPLPFPNVNWKEVVRSTVLVAAVRLVSLGSSSFDDAKVRSASLDTIAKFKTSLCLKNACKGVAAVARKVLSLSQFSQAESEADRTAISCGVPIDPLYALDVTSIAVLERNTDRFTVLELQSRAKEFRLRTLAFQELLLSWDKGLQQALRQLGRETSLFARAKVASELQEEEGVFDNRDIPMFVVLAFDIVKNIVEYSERICKGVCRMDGWYSSHEDRWTDIFLHTLALCEVLTSYDQEAQTVVFGSLVSWASSWSKIENIHLMEFMPGLSILKGRVDLLTNIMRKSLAEPGMLTMPKRLQGQKLEAELSAAVLNSQRSLLKYSEIDAVVKAIISTRVDNIVLNTQLFDSFRKLLSSIPEASGDDFAFEQLGTFEVWASVSRCSVLDALWRQMMTLSDPHMIEAFHKLKNYFHKIASETKCVSSFQLLTILAIQRLYWIFDYHSTNPNGIFKTVGQFGNIFKPFLTALLRETSAPTPVPSKNSKSEVVCSNGVAHSVMKADNNGLKNLFWDLDGAREKSVNVFSIVTCGISAFTDCSLESQRLLLKFLILALHSAFLLPENECFRLLEIASQDCEACTISLSETLDSFFVGGTDLCSTKRSLIAILQMCLKTALKSSQQDSKRSLSLSQDIQKGLLWVCSGLLRLQGHLEFLNSFNGVDPCDLAQSVMVTTLNGSLNANATKYAFEIIGRYRLGGDHALDSIPVSRLTRNKKECDELYKSAYQRFIERPRENELFSSYETTVSNTVVSLVQVANQNGLLNKLNRGLTGRALSQVKEELQMFQRSCETMLQTFECGASRSHFRDLSVDFELGLSECLHGFSTLLSWCEKQFLMTDVHLSNKLKFFSELSYFPRCAFSRDDYPVSTPIRQCLEVFRNGSFLLSCAEYFVEIVLRDGLRTFDQICESFDLIVQAWKTSLLHNEEEMKQKSSLHILQEATKVESQKTSHVVKMLEVDEEADYVDTFNPITVGVEESMMGLVADTSLVNETESNRQIDPHSSSFKGLNVDAEAFWRLHKRVFLSSDSPFPNQSLSLDKMRLLASNLHPFFCEVLVPSEHNSNIWNLVCASNVIDRFSEAKVEEYNFYKSNNVSELAKASSALRSLAKVIKKLQRDAFEETGPHPVLVEIFEAIKRVAKSCRTDLPLSIVVIGIEGILRKVDEWHRLFATKATRFDAQVETLSVLVVRWRKLELASWQYLLKERKLRFAAQASKWFFLLYDVIINHCLVENGGSDRWKRDVVGLVDQFLRSSPCGEFSCRIDMVLSLSEHLSFLMRGNEQGSKGAHIIRAVGWFYAHYIPQVNASISDLEIVVNRKLEEFVKLVSWTATEDLGSSLTMSKEKNKHLEYFRLKAASERTRRKLHKLYLETDAIFRKPVYEFISKEVAAIGLKSIDSEDDMMVNKHSLGVTCFSEKISISCKNLVAFFASEAAADISLYSYSIESDKGLLPRVYDLWGKIKRFGSSLIENDVSTISGAIKSIGHVRAMIKQQVKDFQSAKDQNIQKKKRSLVELLRTLKRLGLSQFASTMVKDMNDPCLVFSPPSPTNCPEFNDVADDMFILCTRQVRRLLEVFDVRVRNSDISRDEASKCLSSCCHLLNQSFKERRALRDCSESIQQVCNELSLLKNVCDPSCELTRQRHLSLHILENLKDSIRRLNSIGEDFAIVEDIVHPAKLGAKVPSEMERSVSLDLHLEFALRQNIGAESFDNLEVIHKKLRICTAAIRNIVDGKDARIIRELPIKKSSLVHSKLRRACKRTIVQLKELSHTLEKANDAVSHLSSANALSLLVRPTLEFLQRVQEELSAEERRNRVEVDSNALVYDMRHSADEVIKQILINTQQILSWAGVYNKTEFKSNLEEKVANDSEQVLNNAMTTSHCMLSSFLSASGLLIIDSLLSKNQKRLEDFVDCCDLLSPKQRSEIVNLQLTLGSFVQTFMNSIAVPMYEKCARYHCHSLSFLRTLSALFVGLFQDGFCRPAPESSANDALEINQDVSGTGFGDADGDMTGALNVSDQVEDEEQLLGLQEGKDKAPDQSLNEEQVDEPGFEMTTDFDGQIENAPNQEQDSEEQSGEADKSEKQLSGSREKGNQILDERMWGKDDADAENVDESEGRGNDDNQEHTDNIIAKEGSDHLRQDSNKDRNGTDNNQKDLGNNSEDNRSEEDEDKNLEIEGTDGRGHDEENRKQRGLEGEPLCDAGDEDGGGLEYGSSSEDPYDNSDTGKDSGSKTLRNTAGGKEDLSNEPDIGESKAPDREEMDTENDFEENKTREDQCNAIEGDVCDEEMLGDHSHAEGSYRDFDAASEGNENEEFEGLNMNLEDVSASGEKDNDGPQEHVNSSMVDDDDSLTHGSEYNMNGSADNAEVDVAPTVALVEGSATTSHAGGNTQQAFLSDASKLNIDNREHPMNSQSEDGEGAGLSLGKHATGGSGEKGKDNIGNQDGCDVDAPIPKMADPNPLRALADNDLVERWKNMLKEIERARKEEHNAETGRNRNDEGETKPQEWQYANSKNINDGAALGAATEEQHTPLHTNTETEKGEVDEGEDIESHFTIADKSINDQSAQSRFLEPNQLSNEAEEKDATDSAGNLRPDEVYKDEGTHKVQQHPVRRAVCEKNDQNIDEGNVQHDKDHLVNSSNSVWDGDVDAYAESEASIETGIELIGAKSQVVMESLGFKEACELWRQLEAKVSANSSALCEELRLVLEATERSGLGGGYRSGKRLNMRKVIDFVASDFRKDRIWMRRVRAERRAYDIMIAIDDSASMGEGDAGVLALEAVALVVSALSKLEVGRVAVASFGASTHTVRDFDRALPVSLDDGGAMLRHFTFSQRETNVVDLLQFICAKMGGGEGIGESIGSSSTNGGAERFSLVFVVSDGHVSRRDEIRRRVRLLKESNVLVAFIIVEGVHSEGYKHDGSTLSRVAGMPNCNNGGSASIFDVKRVEFDEKGNLSVLPYMQDFPVPFYVVVHDVRLLPRVIADSLRHWIELASS